MSINRRHIIQYKPEGVANIFAPTIRINGKFVNTTMGPAGSNELDFNNVMYPQNPTISVSRSHAQQQDLSNQGFNQVYQHLFSNLINSDSEYSSSSIPASSSADSSSAYGLGRQSFDSDLASFFSQTLAPQLNCINAGGICQPSNKCTGKNLGDCKMNDNSNYICCDEDIQPESSNGDSSFLNTGSGYANTVTSHSGTKGTNVQTTEGAKQPNDLTMIYLDIKYQDAIFGDLGYSDKEDIKNNTLDRIINQANQYKISLSKNDVQEIKTMSGSIVIRIYFKNNYDMRVKIKSLVNKLTPKPSVLNIYYKQNLLKTQSITSSVNFLNEEGSRLSITQTNPQSSNSKTGMSGDTIIPSNFGVEKNYCHQMCGIESKNTKENENRYLVPSNSYNKWRECTPGCKTHDCNNCEGDDNYVQPTDIAKLTQLGYIDTPDKDIKQTNFVSGYPKQTKRNDVNKCYEKTIDQCHESDDCFHCISSLPKNVRKCSAIGANGDYICDSQYSSACVPIFNSGAQLKTYNEDPFHNKDRYTFTNQKLPEVGNKNVLDYPFLGQCEAPIKRTLTQEEKRQILYKKMGRPY